MAKAVDFQLDFFSLVAALGSVFLSGRGSSCTRSRTVAVCFV